jgi:hypothetical protein
MSIFVDGELSCYSFPTSQGRLDVIAEVTITGSKLELRDPAVYSGDGRRVFLGVRPILEIARQVEALAKLQGFSALLVTGKRLSGATPGRAVLLERKIR